MSEISFTAGITFDDDKALTVDVTGIDGEGISYIAEDGPHVARWADVKAVMLATTDHMLESAGALFSMAEALQETDDTASEKTADMRRLGIGLVQQAAPQMCPLGDGCGLRPR